MTDLIIICKYKLCFPTCSKSHLEGKDRKTKTTNYNPNTKIEQTPQSATLPAPLQWSHLMIKRSTYFNINNKKDAALETGTASLN